MGMEKKSKNRWCVLRNVKLLNGWNTNKVKEDKKCKQESEVNNNNKGK